MKTILVLIALTVAVGSKTDAQKYSVADFADFTKSPTEHVLNILEQPFEVRSVKGVIEFKNGALEPLEGVVFEIQGPGMNKQIRHGKTDQQGRFRLNGLPKGSYKFKATLNGYQSSVGTILVSPNAAKSNAIKIEMRIGN